MKKIYCLFACVAFGAALTACSNDDADAGAPAPAVGNLKFVTKAPAGDARGPVYTADEFRILAFKKSASGNDYTYWKDIPVGGMSFDGSVLAGTVQFPAGDYKFLPSYGLVTPGNYTWPTLAGSTLSNDLYVTHTAASFPAAFMLSMPLDAVPSYSVKLDGTQQTVSSTLRRCVSRVDVLFLRADKDAATGAYTEKAGDDVFGPEGLATAELRFTDANSKLGLSGEKIDGVFDATHRIAASGDVVTMGTGTATTFGSEGYKTYDDVLPTDIVSGSAHLRGTYLIPNADNTAATGLTLALTSGEGSVRTIALTDKIPVERNKVTLIRIYVLGDNVFTTGVDFDVTIDTAWDGINYVDQEID